MLSRHKIAPQLSRFFAFLIPLLLALHWPLIAARQHVGMMLAVLRIGLLGSALFLVLLWLGTGLTRAELKWALVLGSFLMLYLAAALCGTDVLRGIQDWMRIATAMFVGFGITRALRHPPTAKAFGTSLILGSLISCALILAVYWHYMGLSAPTYESLRIFKESVLRGSGVALNPLAGATLLFCLLGMCFLRSTWRLRIIVSFVALVVATLTGSRAPLGLLFLGGVILLAINAARSKAMVFRVMAWVGVFLAVLVVSAVLWQATPFAISSVTEGRYDVWTVGWAKFAERPLIGYGPDSWRDDLFTRLPGYYKETSALLKLKAGGYHSEYVTLLAEGGLLCFVPALLLLTLLLRDCLRITFQSPQESNGRQIVTFTGLFLCLRALIEIPGLFGYGQDVTDYLAYMFVAVVASKSALLYRSDVRSFQSESEETTPRSFHFVTAASVHPTSV